MQAILPVEALIRKDRYVVFAGLLGVTALASAYTAYLAWDMQNLRQIVVDADDGKLDD